MLIEIIPQPSLNLGGHLIPITNFSDYLENGCVAINVNGEINLFKNSDLCSLSADDYYYNTEDEYDYGLLLAQIKTGAEITPKLIRLNYDLVDDVDLLDLLLN